MRLGRFLAAGGLGILLIGVACGGNSDGAAGAPTSPTPSPGPATDPSPGATGTTITISAEGASPRQITVPAGSRVTFINTDRRPHDMASDPHPDHTDCPELNQVGHLEPGQQRESGNLNTPRRCGFHDHINDANRALQGSVTIQ